MKTRNDWSPIPLAVCEVCSLIWGLTILGGTGYAVFFLGCSGWWFLLALLITGGWTCKNCRSPEQIKAAKEVGEE